jgi:MHS family metabolite:H+ symporter-like MFS transporter
VCDRRSEAEVRHFVARPLGGLFFATYGDKVGRKWVLVITILLMGGASTLLGLLPPLPRS